MGKTRKIHILIVDDETEFASTLADRLRLRKMDAACSFSGEEALAYLMENPVDVVLVDFEMTDMSGIQLLTKIKASWPKIAVILLTGHGSVDTGILGMEHGAFDYLTKPVDLNLLIDRITEAFQAIKEKKLS